MKDSTSSTSTGLRCLTARSWSPYAAGIGIGVLSWLAFLLVDKPIGMSTEISRFSGWLTGLFAGWDSVVSNSYWAEKTPSFGYSTMFLIFTAVGALFSALLGRDFKLETVPRVWRDHFGSAKLPRLLTAFAGGFLVLYGARMAGGCTSGHGLSGTMQLALSGWIFFPVLFGAGIATAALLFRRKPQS